ncbi:MAG: TrbI/VirB10 family protein [Acidobacteriaceae bacterium]
MQEEKENQAAQPSLASASASLPETASTVQDRRTQPPGVVSKQTQSYLMAGLSVLILLAVLFSKNHAKPAAKPPASASTAAMTDANQSKIEQFQKDLTAEQRAMEAQRQAAAQSASATNPRGGQNATATGANPSQSVAAAPPRDPIADAEKALAFKARFASNLVTPDDNMTRNPSVQNASASMVNESLPASTAPQQIAGRIPSDGRNAKANAGNRPTEVNLNSAHDQPYVLFEGTILDTALVNRLVGDFAGPVKVMVTNPVYSQDRQHVLIPEGTFLLGDVQKVSGMGQRRLAVRFHRMLMPDGYSVDLDQFHGLDQAGATGLSDQVNNHYIEIFGASIALGIVSGAAEATTYGSGYNVSGPAMYEQGVASSLSQSGAHVLDRFINILPTITIREGHRIKVYLTQDLLLPAYENHDTPGDF